MANDTPDYSGEGTPQQATMQTIAAGTGAGTVNVSLVPTVHTVMVVWEGNLGMGNSFVVNGHVTGVQYFSGSGANFSAAGFAIFPVASIRDTSLDVVITEGIPTAVPITVIGIPYSAAVDVLSGLGQSTIPVSIAGTVQINGTVLPGAASASNILGGFSGAPAGATLITIPATRVWLGSVWVSGTGNAGGLAAVDVQTAGAAATPTAGTSVCKVIIPTGAAGDQSLSVSGVYVSAGVSSVSLVLATSNSPAPQAGAIGLLL